MIKSDIKNQRNQVVMYKVLEKFLRLIHPFMPYISEEIWQRIYNQGQSPGGGVPGNSIMIQPWPHVQEQMIDKKKEDKLNLIFEIIASIRNIRQELEIPLQKEIGVIIASPNQENRKLIEEMSGQIKKIAKLSNLNINAKYSHVKSSVSGVIKDVHVTCLLSGIIDLEREKAKLDARIRELAAQISAKKKTLSNKAFLKKAPEEIVEKESDGLKELNGILKRIKEIKNELQ